MGKKATTPKPWMVSRLGEELGDLVATLLSE